MRYSKNTAFNLPPNYPLQHQKLYQFRRMSVVSSAPPSLTQPGHEALDITRTLAPGLIGLQTKRPRQISASQHGTFAAGNLFANILLNIIVFCYLFSVLDFNLLHCTYCIFGTRSDLMYQFTVLMMKVLIQCHSGQAAG